MNVLARYFNWLQKGNPAGLVDRFPEIDENGGTSVKGIYVVGDLTGIPLFKLAASPTSLSPASSQGRTPSLLRSPSL